MKIVEAAERRLVADEPNGYAAHLTQMRPPLIVAFLILSGRSQPDVLPLTGREHAPQVLRSLGQQQPIKLRRCRDKVEQVRTPLPWNLIVKHVRQRGTEHARAAAVRGLGPLPRLPPIRLGGPLAL